MGPVELKVVMLGKENGGKTSLVERFLYDRFIGNQYQATVGAAFGARKVEVDGKSLTMAIWDTAGSERYEAMSRIYYRDAKAAVICYDLTEKSSWDRTKFWVEEVRRCEEDCIVYLCGTKTDLIDKNSCPRQISTQEVERFAEEIKATFLETSSKSGKNVRELFTLVAEDFVRKNGDNSIQRMSTLNLELTPSQSWNKCCYRR